MEILVPIIFIVAIVVVLYLLTQSKVQIVPEEERLVVYRLGRFHRIAGPGVVVLQRSLDEVKRTLHVRDEPHHIRVNNIFISGIPFGYTLDLWYHFDLNAAAGNDRAQLVNLAQFSDEERNQQVGTKVREALVESAAQIEKSYKPKGTDFFHKLLPIIPGLPECDSLLNDVKRRLRESLPSVGAVLNEKQPITVLNIQLGPDIVNSFSRGRVATMLKETFPQLSPTLLLQAVSSIEGIDLPQQQVVFEGAAADAAMDMRIDEEGTATRVRVKPTRPVAADGQSPSKTEAETPVPKEQLTKDDLSVLKRVPA
ncbi:MAG: hypothetical protein R3C14_35360 [Caldilineaceae bacterium]